MAMIELNEHRQNNSSLRTKGPKKSLNLDLTPMVDLGFLLITFFVFTTTVSQPLTMNLNMPAADQTIHTNVPQSGAITLLLGKGNNLFYYFGMNPQEATRSTYKEIRTIIINKKGNTAPEKFFVVIKPVEEASFKNVVDILDEMNIDDVSRYAMTVPSDWDLELINEGR